MDIKNEPDHIVENPVHIRDLNATISDQLGVNHSQLPYKYQGLDQTRTGVEKAKVVRKVLV